MAEEDWGKLVVAEGDQGKLLAAKRERVKLVVAATLVVLTAHLVAGVILKVESNIDTTLR